MCIKSLLNHAVKNISSSYKVSKISDSEMPKYYLIVLLICLCLNNFSCMLLYYCPNLINIPLFTEKGQIILSANNTFMGPIIPEFANCDLQSACAITDNIAATYNISYGKKGTPGDKHDNYHEHLFQEFGIGYYKPFMNIFRFENYIGFGHGCSETRIYEDEYFESAKGKYNRIFIYPALGISKPLKCNTKNDPERVDLGIAFRISEVRWYDIKKIFIDP